jgi:hypothetical protein
MIQLKLQSVGLNREFEAFLVLDPQQYVGNVFWIVPVVRQGAQRKTQGDAQFPQQSRRINPDVKDVGADDMFDFSSD